jgi:hypothetical protein
MSRFLGAMAFGRLNQPARSGSDCPGEIILHGVDLGETGKGTAPVGAQVRIVPVLVRRA